MFKLLWCFTDNTIIPVTGSSTIQAECPFGMRLLYCGNNNTQESNVEKYRSSKPISSTTCQCYDFFGVKCEAWCTSAPVNGIEIQSTTSNGKFKATCSSGKQALGCYLSPQQDQYPDYWPAFYPTDGGTSCTCVHYFGAECLAMCAANIKNYEIIEVLGKRSVIVSCAKPGNMVLGCGSEIIENNYTYQNNFPSTRVSTNTSCECKNVFWVKCFAICGYLSSTTSSTTATTTTTTTDPSKYAKILVFQECLAMGASQVGSALIIEYSGSVLNTSWIQTHYCFYSEKKFSKH